MKILGWLNHFHQKSSSTQKTEPKYFREQLPYEEPRWELLGGKYAVFRKLGEGGFGTVHLVRDRNDLGRTLAAKTVNPCSDYSDIANIFIAREAAALQRVRHQNIIEFVDHGIDKRLLKGGHYLVTEYFEGDLLSDILEREGRLTWEKTKTLVLALCDALQAVHEAGMAHCDVKPSNIFIANQQLKLFDFGFVKFATEIHPERPAYAVGTPTYMAPEQASGNDFDHRIDIYAVGILMYRALCGFEPIRGQSEIETLKMQRDVQPLEPSMACPVAHIPQPVESIIMRALEKDPEARFQSAAELKKAVSSV